MLPKRLFEAHERKTKKRSDLQRILASNEFEPSYREVSLSDVDFHEDGFLEIEGEQLPYLQGVHEDLARAAGIPLSFAYDITFKLFRHNFNARKKEKAKGLTLCMVRDTVVGVAGAKYETARTLDILNRIDLDKWELEEATISDFGVKFNLIIPGLTVEPERGDIINVGMQISNSETGGDGLRANLFTFRLACTNGAVIREVNSTVYWKKFKKRTYDSSLKAFLSALEKSKSAAEGIAASVYENVTDRHVSDDQFVSLVRGLQRRVGNVERAENILGLEPGERQSIQRLVRERGRHENAEPTRFMTFDVHNRITAAAREERLLLRQSLEELGGSLLFSSPSKN